VTKEKFDTCQTPSYAGVKDIWAIRCEVFHFEPLPNQLATFFTQLPYI
jgi:hypothetical protein